MGLFSKKQKVDYDALFKDKYKVINQLMMQANQELDFLVKESLLALVVKEYDVLIDYIDQGAHFEKEHFIALKQNAQQELDTVRHINQDE